MFARIAAGTHAAQRYWGLVCWAGIAVGLGAAAPAVAESRTPADNEVIGYAAADRDGASTSWTLAVGTPYLYVPYIGTEGAGSVAAVDAGSGVGAVLFQRPYFGTRDTGCAPDLGSDARPDLKWRGATAGFSPSVEAPAEAGAAAERISSLIIYRKDLGPPPGALLLNRRLTLGQSCRRAVHKTFFDRLFVPIATPPEPARCYNLSGTYPREGGQDFKVDITSADRLVLLQPADLDDGYRGVRHRFRVTMFDSEGCRGGAGEFRSVGQETGDIKLDQVGLRDRARSIKIVYEGGPLAPYYVAPAATPVASKDPVPPPPAAATVTPEPTQPSQAKAAPAPSAPTASAPTSSTTAELAAPTPAPAPSRTDDVVVAPTPEPVEMPVAAPRPAPIPLQAALPAPRLQLPVLKPATPSAAPASTTFEYPVFEIYRLNYCLRWGADCGEPAATAWCKAQGFAKANAWQVDKNIGGLFPTIVLADKRVCAQFLCDGFEEITCSN